MADGQNTSAILGVVRAIAPILGGALGSAALPGVGTAAGAALGGAAVDFIAGKLGLPSDQKTPEAVAQAVAQLPAPTLAQLEYEFKQHCEDNNLTAYLAELEVAKEQIKTNTEEAKSESLFVAGWRPYIGWIGGTGMGYQFLFRPILNGLCHVFGVDPNTTYFPALEMQDLIAVVTTMLGQAYLRSMDKKNGSGNGH